MAMTRRLLLERGLNRIYGDDDRPDEIEVVRADTAEVWIPVRTEFYEANPVPSREYARAFWHYAFPDREMASEFTFMTKPADTTSCDSSLDLFLHCHASVWPKEIEGFPS